MLPSSTRSKAFPPLDAMRRPHQRDMPLTRESPEVVSLRLQNLSHADIIFLPLLVFAGQVVVTQVFPVDSVPRSTSDSPRFGVRRLTCGLPVAIVALRRLRPP